MSLKITVKVAKFGFEVLSARLGMRTSFGLHCNGTNCKTSATVTCFKSMASNAPLFSPRYARRTMLAHADLHSQCVPSQRFCTKRRLVSDLPRSGIRPRWPTGIGRGRGRGMCASGPWQPTHLGRVLQSRSALRVSFPTDPA